MPGAADRIGLEQVVGAHARPHEPAKERLEGALVVVDAREQDRLVIDRKARVGEALAGRDGLAA